ncbi:MAG: aromatic amino acid transporter AroP [Endomicrobiia bacterium]|nr:MAG: aromatic amino acid transporter AroP [Endomicrobiia bacterium]
MSQPHESNLKRKLTNRHIQFITIGGTIGTGLFLATGSAIFIAGPAVILGYAIAGVLIFSIMRQLGEMNTEEPVAGSLSHFANKYWGNFPGFLAGWNYWIIYVMVGIAELTAMAAYLQYWFPTLATWKATLFFFILTNIVNLSAVKAYAEIEFWFAIVKIIAMCGMILTGLYILIINPSLVDGATFKNLWSVTSKHTGNSIFSGFFPHGIVGLITTMPIVIFAFGGLELVGITAAETLDPKKTIPKAINQVVSRILFLYVGSLIILLSLYHWSNLNANDSPFVIIFDKIGFKYAAWTLNFIILTAALSVYSGCIYSNSRTIYGLALQNNAPNVFTKTTKNGVPIAALLLSGILTSSVVPLNYFMPNWSEAFKIVMSFVVICIILNWMLITISHIKFKKQKNLENKKTLFPSPFYPHSNYASLLFIFLILVVMAISPQLSMTKQVIALPIWVLVVYAGYKIFKI